MLRVAIWRRSLSIKEADSDCDRKSYSLFVRLIAPTGREFQIQIIGGCVNAESTN